MKVPASSLKPAPDALAGRAVLVTGAHGGLGGAVARAVAAAGATPILLGRRVPKLTALYDALEAAGAVPAIYPLDLAGATPDDYAQMAQGIGTGVGRLDGIVHCAAEFKGLASIENMPAEDWLTGLHVNLTAPVFLTRALLPLLRSGADPAVLFVLDEPSRVARPFWGAYGVAKHGLHGLVEILHGELASSNIRVHGLVPGPMRTALRSRAYFAENPADVPPPDAYAGACVHLLSREGAATGRAVVEVEAAAENPKPFALTVL